MKNRTVLWDAGGVIYSFNLNKVDLRLANLAQKTPEEVSAIIWGSSACGREYNEGLAGDYHLGKANSSQFYESLIKKLEVKISFSDFKDIWNDIFTLNKKISEFILHLHSSGVQQGILSSTNSLHWEAMNNLFNLEELLGKEKIICTYHADAGYRKPTSALFDCAMRRLGISKDKTVYVDDVKKYLDGAREYGIDKTVHVDINKPDFQERCITEVSSLLGL